MSTMQIKDGSAASKYAKGSGAGTSDDPFVPDVNAGLQVAGADVGSGNPVPVSDAGGSLTVDGAVAITGAVPVTDNGGSLTVDAVSLPLPTGAATAANQATGNTSLAAIGAAVAAVAQDGTDITAPTAMPAGGSGIRGWLSAIWTKLNGSLAVTGTFWPATQPVSAAALPLPAGASTEATLAAASAKLPATLGQKTAANSLSAVLASDQGAVPTSPQSEKTYGTVACGELAGSTGALQCPAVACALIRLKASAANAGKVYLGGAGVTKVDGTTDTTTGFQLSAGDETGWMPISNLNLLYRICDNAGDSLTYFALS